jgi:hypothetical protein
MQVLLDINDAYVPSVTADRLAYNAALPPPADAAPNTAAAGFSSDEAYIQFLNERLLKDIVAKHGVLTSAVVIDGVPQEVSRAQAYEELVSLSLHNIDDPALSEIEKTIALIPDAVLQMRMKNLFRNSGSFHRQKPELIQLWTQAMGRTLAQLDQMFISAAKR